MATADQQSIIVQIADEMVDQLNDAGFVGQTIESFAATRQELVVTDVESLCYLAVSVVPSRLHATRYDLQGRISYEWQIGVWLQKRVDNIPEDTDPLRLLTEEIVALFLSKPLLGVSNVRCIGAIIEQLPTPGQLDRYSTWTNVVLLTMKQTQ